MQALSWSSISWHIEDMHKRLSMCKTNPENDLKSIRHPGHVNGRVVLSSEFKGSSDSFTSFSFELLPLRVKLVATEDPSRFDTEELVFLRPHTLDLTKRRRWISGLSGKFKPNNIQRGVGSPDFDSDTPSSANLLRKAARATKERQKRWISKLFILLLTGKKQRTSSGFIQF